MRDPQQGVQAIAVAVGFASLALLWLGLVLGIVLRDGRALDRVRPATLAAIHHTTMACGLTLGVVHALSWLAVPGGPTRLVDVVVPFTHRTDPVGVALGVAGLELAIAVALSAALRGRLGYHRWRLLHRFGHLAFGLLVVHVLVMGSHTRQWWVSGPIALVAAVTVGVGLWTSGWASRLPHLIAGAFAAPSRRARRVTIHVDASRCTRFGFCQHEAPELFEMRGDGRLRHAWAASAEQVDAAIRAARSCPTRAIILSRQAVRVVVAEPPSEGSPGGQHAARDHEAEEPPRGRRAARETGVPPSAGVTVETTTEDGGSGHAPTE